MDATSITDTAPLPTAPARRRARRLASPGVVSVEHGGPLGLIARAGAVGGVELLVLFAAVLHSGPSLDEIYLCPDALTKLTGLQIGTVRAAVCRLKVRGLLVEVGGDRRGHVTRRHRLDPAALADQAQAIDDTCRRASWRRRRSAA